MCDIFFFFKQKTAYEMRISDWSSDVCSSDLYPLLQRGDAALSATQFTRRLRRFLALLPAPRYVVFDANTDAVLLRHALAGFGLRDFGLGTVVHINEVLLACHAIRDGLEPYLERHSHAPPRRPPSAARAADPTAAFPAGALGV